MRHSALVKGEAILRQMMEVCSKDVKHKEQSLSVDREAVELKLRQPSHAHRPLLDAHPLLTLPDG